MNDVLMTMIDKRRHREFLIAYCPIEYYTKKEMKEMGWGDYDGATWNKDGTTGGEQHTGEKPIQLSFICMKLRMEFLTDTIVYKDGYYNVVIIRPESSKIERYVELLDEAEKICEDKGIKYKRVKVE